VAVDAVTESGLYKEYQMVSHKIKSTSRPNVVYILGDDHRADYLHCAGHQVLRTPHLDQLAEEGVRFSNAFCTSPLCTPSRVCHYTGQWERRHGINFNSRTNLAPEAWAMSFPMLLKEQGYFIGWVGKNHVPAGGGKDGYDSGYFEKVFDYWYGNHGHTGFYPKDSTKFGHLYKNARADTQIEVFTEGVLDFLAPNRQFRAGAAVPLPERPEDRPFCLCVTFNLPHDVGTETMQLRPGDDELYKSEYRGQQHLLHTPATYIPYTKAFENPRLPRSVYNGLYIPEYDYVKRPATLRERQVRTCQTITGMDRFVGRLREQLERQGLADNTIIVFSTDHGLHHGEHGIGGKSFLYEEDIRIPMIIYDPRLRDMAVPRIRDEMVVVPDLAPTIMDLCGLAIPNTMQGASMRSLLSGGSPSWRDSIFTEQLMDIQNYPRSESVRTRDWKYIRYFARTENPRQANWAFRDTLENYNDSLNSTLDGERPVYEELFNLRDDPGETTNLALDSSQRGRCDSLQEQLLTMGKAVRAPGGKPLTIPNIS
jgi:arylsulfatase A-like enzyme